MSLGDQDRGRQQHDIRAALAKCDIVRLRNLLGKVLAHDATGLQRIILAECEHSTAIQQQVEAELFGQVVPRSSETVTSQLNNLDTAVDDEDFGMSSGDEADMLQLSQRYKTQPILGKRKSQDQLSNVNKRTREDASSGPILEVAKKVLKENFGMDAFRLKQEQAISRLLEGESSVVVFPTGGGKSLCYQLPALCFKELDRIASQRQGHAESGITLVVSPLIALMKDQVDALRRRNIRAAVLDSTKTREEYLETVNAMRDGSLDILYCAPERLNNEGFVASMANVKGGVRLLAVDEAHCISEWGHAFRPDYLKVARFAKEIEAERVVCLTATATPKVAQDVCDAFNVPTEGLFRTTTYRPNLRLLAESYQIKEESYPKLRKFLKDHPGPTIVYVTLQRHTEKLAEQLRDHGFNASHFHAGMNKVEKARCQDEFMASKDMIVVATIAFGMGIDKANIRNVIHYDIPRSLEGYSQEIGRAGRDGLQSSCMLYLCAEDMHLRESFARGDLPSMTSISSFLNEVFSMTPTTGPNSCVEVNLYSQAREHDIRPTVLNNIYAQLELRFGFVRATTPKYTKYSYKSIRPFNQDHSPAAVALQTHTIKAKTLCHVDIEAAARTSEVPRVDLVAKLNNWHDEQYIDLQAAGVVNVFRVLKPFPTSSTERQQVVDALYHDLVVREQQDLNRMEQVTNLVTGSECFCKTLAQHFGDTLPNDAQECGHCTWCERNTAVKKVTPPEREWNAAAFSKVLKACPDRDDPRYLARVAFGISSPRVTRSQAQTASVFGSMEDHDFMTLLKAFQEVCDSDDTEDVTCLPARSPSQQKTRKQVRRR